MLLNLLTAVVALVAPAQQPDERVLIVGDSWSEYTAVFGSLDASFADFGHPDKRAVELDTAIGGTTAADWTTPAYQQRIVNALANYPDVDVVHLTIGGNDFFAGWNANMSASAERALFEDIADDVENVVDFIHSQNPNLQVLMSSYDFPNFDEQLALNPLYFILWAALGFPSAQEINDAGARGQYIIGQRLVTKPNTHVIHHFGLLHYLYGYPQKGIGPRTLAPPVQWAPGRQPRVGGNPSLHGTPDWMLDCIHLNPTGSYWVAQHCTWFFYDAWFTANP